MKTTEDYHRIGQWFISNIIKNTENPLMAHRGLELLEKFNSWILTIPESIATMLLSVYTVAIHCSYRSYTEKNIGMPDGKMYSKSEINYLAICN